MANPVEFEPKALWIKNEERFFGSAQHYVVLVCDQTALPDEAKRGEANLVALALTPKEFQDAVYRAEKNPEDVRTFINMLVKGE